MRATNILLGIIAVILALFFGLQLAEQDRDVRYLINFNKFIKANGIQTDDETAYFVGLIRQSPYLFTYNRGMVGKYLQQNNQGAAPQGQQPAQPK